MNVGSVWVDINGDISDLEAKMSQAERAVSDLGRRMADVGKTLTVGLSLPIAALGGVAVKAATDLDSLKRGLVAVAGSSEAAEAQLVRLQEVAKLPGLGFREAIQGSVRLQAAGFAALEAEAALKAFGNALATVGAGKAELDQVTRALTQIISKGKVSAEEINQIAEVVPQIRVAMEAAFGTANTEKIQKMGLEASDFIRGIVAELAKLEQVTGGPANAFENLSDAVFRASAAIGNQLLPVVIPMLEGLTRVLSEVRKLSPETVKLGIAIAGAAAAMGPMLVIVGSLTKAVVAFKVAGAAAALTFGIGGVVAVALAALSGLFIKNKLDALAAAGAVEQYETSLKNLTEAAADEKFGDITRRIRETRDALAATPETKEELYFVGKSDTLHKRTVENPEFTKLTAQLEGLYDEMGIVARRMSELDASAAAGIKNGITTPLQTAAEAAKALEIALDKAMRAVTGLRGMPAPDLDYLEGDDPGAWNHTTGFRALSENDMARVNPMDLSTKSVPGLPGEIVPKEAPGIIDKALAPFKKAAGMLGVSLTAVAGAFLVLKPMFEGFMEVIGPVLEKLQKPLVQIGRIIGGIVAPLLELLADPLAILANLVAALLEPMRLMANIIGSLLVPVMNLLGTIIKGVTWVFSWLMTAIGWLVKGLGAFIDKIAGWLTDWGDKLETWGQDVIDNAKAAREGTLATEEATEAVKSFAESLTNVPRAINLQLLRLRASTAGLGGAVTGGPLSPPSGTPGHTTPIGTVSFGNVIIHAAPGDSGSDLWRKFEGEARRQVSLGNPFARRLAGAT